MKSISGKLYLIGLMLLLPVTGLLIAQEPELSDSTLSNFSVEELVKVRKMFGKRREGLVKEQEKIRERGVDVTKEFLDKSKEENSNQDKVLIRVAEYYIEEEDLDFERRFDQYEKDYEAYEQQRKAFARGELRVEPKEPPQPLRNYEKAIGIYDLIIRNFPESDLVDDAYYNKAYLLDEMDEDEAARQIFQTIIDEFPESSYAPEAYMKLAESFFYPEPGDDTAETILKLNKAIQLYKNVLQYKDSPRYDEALYKLGWSYYRLAGDNSEYYTDAITYFMGVVRDIERLREADPSRELVRTDVEPEALQFVAASFIDPSYSKSGVASAKSFIEKLDKPRYGIDVMENMGDRYAKITNWSESIDAYSQLLLMYPDYDHAPRVQKKIADAYIADEQYERAFEERRSLFENYNPKSEWYARLEQSEAPDRISALDEAYRITEEAFRTNITYLYNLASQKESSNESSKADYEQFVTFCEKYLENFPTDENAYEINWALAYVLDTKLSRFQEAFTEYIKVSNDYLEASHQFDAAINAITSADTLVKIALTHKEPGEPGGGATGLEVSDLVPEEKMLSEAYDNFIKLFPASSETPSVLARAGALYYNHRQYDLAKKYYKTMVTKFPEAQQKSVGLISLMNSYFFLGQYRDAEIVAKKILDSPDVPADQVEVAKSRIGESIYKNGEKLEQEGDHLGAAREYRRVYEEAPLYVKFVDLSLFRSARNFEEANEWQKAIETYEILVSEYRDSKQVLPSLNNIAADYKELEDFLNVAKTNERIFTTYPGTSEAENALFNASLFYEKAEAWQEAIRANNLYIQTYPGNAESKDLLFENAKFYLKLDDLASANKIYEDFARIYPNDPRTVEAFYNRGVYYFRQGQNESAKAEFNKAIARSDEFSRVGRDPNLYYAAEANYKLGQILYREYKSITLSYPQSTLRAQLEQKQKMLTDVEKAFTRVIGLGSIRSFEAMYSIAEAYEEFANAIANQALPDNLSKEQRLVQEDQIFKASVPAYDRAVEEYKNVMVNLPVLAEKLDVSLDSTKVNAPAAPAPQGDTTVVVQKEVKEDSSTAVALKWYGRAKEKISLIQYDVAQRSSEFISEYLQVDNPNSGLKALIFKDQVLTQLVAPQVRTTIDAHLNNIKVAKELNLDNIYVEESKRQVLLARNILGDQYHKMMREALELYKSSIPTQEALIEEGESAVTPDGQDYYDYQDNQMMQLIFVADRFAKTALNQYKTTYQMAIDNGIENDARLTTEQKLFNFGYDAGQYFTEVAQVPRRKSEYFLARFDSTQNQNYQLGSTFFDDQNFELSSHSREIYEFAYDIAKEFQIENVWTQLILAKLVELNPAKYLQDLPKEERSLASDSTWLATRQYVAGWNQVEFDDQTWQHAVPSGLPLGTSSPVFDSLGVAPLAIWGVSEASTPAGSSAPAGGNPLEIGDVDVDTTGQGSALPADTSGMSVTPVSEPDTLTEYFRKYLDLPSSPIDGWLAIAGDDQYRLFINDVYIVGQDENGFVKPQLIPFSTFSGFLKEGRNLVAVSVTDTDGPPRNGLRLQLLLKFVPGDIKDTVERIRRSIVPTDIDPVLLKKNAVLNKNRIIE